jgi:hypothetical protein
MKKLLIISTLIWTLISCKKEEITDKNILNLPKPIILKVFDEIPKSSMEFNIDNAAINGKKITLTISHGGGCDPNHSFKLYKINSTTSNCITQEFQLVFTTNNHCKRLDYSNISFDLNSEQLCSKSIIIKGGNRDLEINF